VPIRLCIELMLIKVFVCSGLNDDITGLTYRFNNSPKKKIFMFTSRHSWQSNLLCSKVQSLAILWLGSSSQHLL